MKLLKAFRPQSLPPLPPHFFFGVATSDHQVEAYDPEREDIRDVWERERGLTPRGRATDFERRFEEDVRLARDLGCTAFRFSVAWSRVEPSPGRFEERVFDYYCRLLAAIRHAGMDAILTLHHLTWPLHIEERGGLLAEQFPNWFVNYTREVVARLGEDVRYWITFNEPNGLILGYIKPWWEPNYYFPPGMPEGATLADQMEAVRRVIRNLFMAHQKARAVIRAHNPQALVGANPVLIGLPLWLQRLIDWNVTRIRTPADLTGQSKRFAHRPFPEPHRVDVVIASMTPTYERAQEVMFSETYFATGQRLLVRAESPITTPHDLVGKAVAVVRTSTAEGLITQVVPGVRRVIVRDRKAALAALEDGRADAFLADEAILRGLMRQHPNRYRLVGARLTQEPYAAAVTPGNTELLDVVDQTIRAFKESGAWAVSAAQHIGRSAPPPPRTTSRWLATTSHSPLVRVAAQRLGPNPHPVPLAPQGTGLRRIQERGYLTVGVTADVPGLGYRDPSSKQFIGLEIDIARAIAQRLFGDPNCVRFVAVNTSSRIPSLRSALRIIDPLLKQYAIFSTIIAADWWHLGMAGKLPDFLCPKECVRQQDFVGIDYYWGTRSLRPSRVQRLISLSAGRFDLAPVWPDALYHLLHHQAKRFPGLPLVVIENGCVEQADGIDRATYLRHHVAQVQRAVADGLNVIGYVCWAITSNREWGLKFGSENDFGLYHIDLDTDPELKRMPTAAASAYRAIIANRGTGESAYLYAASELSTQERSLRHPPTTVGS